MKGLRYLLLLALLAVYSAAAAALDPDTDTVSPAAQADAESVPSKLLAATINESTNNATNTPSNTPTTAPTRTGPTLNGPSLGSAVVATNPVGVFLTLIFIVVIILAAAWLLRRVGPVSMVGGQSIRILAVTSLGAREKILVIDVAGQQELIGVAPGRISHLHHYDQAVIDIDSNLQNNFSSKLKQLLDAGQRGAKS